MTLKINDVIGTITPLASGTRLRFDFSTYADYYPTTYGTTAVVEIDQVIERLETSSDPSRPHDYKGDLWGKVTKINGIPVPQPAYMGIMYHDKLTFAPYRICAENYTVIGETEPTPGPAPATDLIDLNMSLNEKVLTVRGKAGTAWQIYFMNDETLEKTRLK